MLTRVTKRPENRERTTERSERTGGSDRNETRVELWREATETGGRNEFDRVAERLRHLEERGDVDAAAVETWDRYVDVAGGYPDDEVPRTTLDRLGKLKRWAWRHGSDASISTESRTVGRGRMGPPTQMRRVPRAALVEFENGVVTNVTLCDEYTGCLTERLRTIAERERPATEERDDGEPLERVLS